MPLNYFITSIDENFRRPDNMIYKMSRLAEVQLACVIEALIKRNPINANQVIASFSNLMQLKKAN